MNSPKTDLKVDKAFAEALDKTLFTWASKQRPAYVNRVELLARAAQEKYPYSKLIEMRRYSNGFSISQPGLFSLLHHHQWRMLTWVKF